MDIYVYGIVASCHVATPVHVLRGIGGAHPCGARGL